MERFRARFDAADKRVRETRMVVYAALADWPTRKPELPENEELIYRSHTAESTVRGSFAGTAHPTLQPHLGRRLHGVERAVAEAKEFTAEPYLDAHLATRQRLALNATLRLESLTTALAAWAVRYPGLAAMSSYEPPHCFTRIVRTLATPPPDDGTLAQLDALFLVVSEEATTRLDPSAGEVLSAVRDRLAAIALTREGDLREAALRLTAHVGEFMSLVDGREGLLDGELSYVLRRALRALERRGGAL